MDGDKIKKKLFTYARDLALEKINKTLDKKLAANNDSPPSGNEAEPLQSKPRTEGRHSVRRSRQQEPNYRAEDKVDDIEQYVQRRHHRVRHHQQDRRARYSRVKDGEGSSVDDEADSADDQMTDLVEMSNSRRCHIYVANERRNSSRSHQPPKVAAGKGGGGSDRGSGNGRASNSIVLRKAPLPPVPLTYAPVPRRRSYDPEFLSQLRRQSTTRRNRNSRVRKSVFTEEDEDDDFVTADDETSDELGSDGSNDDSESDQKLYDFKHKLRSSGSTTANGSINKYVYADIENQKAQINKSARLNRPQRQALSLDMPKYPRSHDEEQPKEYSSQLRTPLSTPGGLHNVHGGTSTADYSGYIQKKSLAQGMMDLALLSANINQMRYLLEYKDNQPYFATSFTLVITSLFLQIAVSLTLIWNIRFNVKKRNEMKEADRVNNIGVMGIFLVTVINVALSTFGGAPAPKEIRIGGGGDAGMVTPTFDDGSGDIALPEHIVYT